MALFSPYREGLLPAVRRQLETGEQSKRLLLFRRQLANLKNVVGADFDAIFLGLAARTVNQRFELTGFGFAAIFQLLLGAVSHLPSCLNKCLYDTSLIFLILSLK